MCYHKNMKILLKLCLWLGILCAAFLWFLGYESPSQALNAPALHTAKEQIIEQTEDQLSRRDRIYRLFHFKAAVEEALDKRIPAQQRVPGTQISSTMKDAIVATEDKRYYDHGALDIFGIARAFYTNVVAGETLEGGSTITQQLVKNLFLSSKRIMSRKVEEMILAYLMEYYYTKEEILTMYLNSIYYGNDFYGIQAASEGYFETAPKDINLSQAAMLAGMPQAPSYYNPISNYGAAKQRQKTVLQLMAEQRYITYKEADRAYYNSRDLHFQYREK